MNKSNLNFGQVTQGQMLGLMLLAYIFSFAIRMIWVWQFQDNPSFLWNNELMINTNDGYFFAAGAQQALEGLHMENPRVFGMWDYGVIFFTTLLVKITPFSLETIILYMPALISSLVVIPMILIARLYNQTLWGFFAALLGSITWSYYNRTMIGYYDTDMFSAMAPMFILFFLMKSTIDLKLKTALFAALTIVIYPFLYDQGQAIVYAIGIIYGAYMLWFHRNEKVTYASLILIFLALMPIGLDKPINYIVHIILILIAYFILQREELQEKKLLMFASLGMFVLFLFLGDVFGLIASKVISYTIKGTEEGALHFYAVNQTVREAGSIPFETFANRTSGSIFGVLIALVGYVVLVFRRPAFILALPLIGIGIFSLWGGLRFTVYAVPVAAMSAVYLFFVIAEQFKEEKWKYPFIIGATALMIYPNITHIIGYKVPTVLNKAEVEDLVKLDKIADSKDYTLTWWDYGYPVWFYSDTSTLIDGGKHNNDNYIISKILQTPSQELAANLSRLAVETYVDSNYSIVANRLFEGKNPRTLLRELKKPDFKLPPKTREVFLYMPYRMMRIFPTVGVFGNINLKTGATQRKIYFTPVSVAQQANGKVLFSNGTVYDSVNGTVEVIVKENDRYVKKTKKVYRFDAVSYGKDGKTRVQSKLYSMSGEYCVVFLQSYGQILVMDRETYESAYVQMFMLEKYDKELFELVISSPYSKIYRVKK
jgi:dolichyl-diphosphooligosaccharide--protein glycosyltransferase/undecaprenyl-diphosphooligosaccharide--protein glycosyltransferase